MNTEDCIGEQYACQTKAPENFPLQKVGRVVEPATRGRRDLSAGYARGKPRAFAIFRFFDSSWHRWFLSAYILTGVTQQGHRGLPCLLPYAFLREQAPALPTVVNNDVDVFNANFSSFFYP